MYHITMTTTVTRVTRGKRHNLHEQYIEYYKRLISYLKNKMLYIFFFLRTVLF